MRKLVLGVLFLPLVAAAFIGLSPAAPAYAACETQGGQSAAGNIGPFYGFILQDVTAGTKFSASTSAPDGEVWVQVFVPFPNFVEIAYQIGVGSVSVSGTFPADGDYQIVWGNPFASNPNNLASWSLSIGDCAGSSAGISNIEQALATTASDVETSPDAGVVSFLQSRGAFAGSPRLDIYGDCDGRNCNGLAFILIENLVPSAGGQTFDAISGDDWEVIVFYLGPSHVDPTQAVYQINIYGPDGLIDDNQLIIVSSDGSATLVRT